MLQPTMAHHKPRAQPQPLPHTPVARCRWGAVSTAESPQAGSVCSPARPTTSPPPRLPLRRQTNSRTPLSLTSVPHSELQTVPPPGLTRGPLPWPPDRTLWKGDYHSVNTGTSQTPEQQGPMTTASAGPQQSRDVQNHVRANTLLAQNPGVFCAPACTCGGSVHRRHLIGWARDTAQPRAGKDLPNARDPPCSANTGWGQPRASHGTQPTRWGLE